MPSFSHRPGGNYVTGHPHNFCRLAGYLEFNMKVKAHTSYSITYGDDTFELEFEPAYDDYMLHEIRGDQAVVAYLVYDSECRDIEDLIGGNDRIYSFHRHNSKDEIHEGLFALGLNTDGDPDLDKVFDKCGDAAWPLYLSAVRAKYTRQEICEEFEIQHENTLDEEVDDVLYDDFFSAYRIGTVMYDSILEEVLLELWHKAEYFPGNLDAQPLSCYSHGGEVWSLQGEGTQCRWDTARFAGVWVPGPDTVQHLIESAPTAAFAMVRKTRYLRGQDRRYQLVEHVWSDDMNVTTTSVAFSDDYMQLHRRALEIAKARPNPTKEQIAFGRKELAEEAARIYLEEYNDVINGSVFGCVVQTYVKEDDEWVDIGGPDACWGFIGSEYAMEVLKDEYFQPAVARMSTQPA